MAQLHAGHDDAQQEPVGEHIPGIEPGVFRDADDHDAAEGTHGGGQQIAQTLILRGVKRFDGVTLQEAKERLLQVLEAYEEKQ